MKRFAIIPLLAAAFSLPLDAGAQGLRVPDSAKSKGAEASKPAAKGPAQSAGQAASANENETVIEIVKCMLAGLPEDWSVAAMEINLEKPFDTTGDVRYLVARGQDMKPSEPFTPCDTAQPARTLIEARKTQAKERQGWIGARVTVFRDGKFGIRYGYPQ